MRLLKVQKVDDVKEKLKEKFKSILSIEKINVSDALNYYLAEDIYSPCDVPEFNKSRVDGYAVRFDDCKLAQENLPSILNYIGYLNIGEQNTKELKSDECMYIPTGGMIPNNCDAMVMIENTDKLSDEIITVHKSVTKNENITFKGDDIKKDSLIMKKGLLIDERIIGVLLSQGIQNIKVYKKLKVYILSIGDELVESQNSELKIGQTREINSIFCSNALKNNNFEVLGTDLINDDKEKYKNTLLNIMDVYNPDLIITSGGSSKGEYDFTQEVFEEITNNIFCEGIGIKPGKPTILAEKNNKLFIGLPGHPVSSYMILKHIILNSYFEAIENDKIKIVIGKLQHNFSNNQGREMLVLAEIDKIENEYIVKPIYFSSTNIGVLSRADGYFVVKETTEGLKENEKIEVYLF